MYKRFFGILSVFFVLTFLEVGVQTLKAAPLEDDEFFSTFLSSGRRRSQWLHKETEEEGKEYKAIKAHEHRLSMYVEPLSDFTLGIGFTAFVNQYDDLGKDFTSLTQLKGKGVYFDLLYWFALGDLRPLIRAGTGITRYNAKFSRSINGFSHEQDYKIDYLGKAWHVGLGLEWLWLSFFSWFIEVDTSFESLKPKEGHLDDLNDIGGMANLDPKLLHPRFNFDSSAVFLGFKVSL